MGSSLQRRSNACGALKVLLQGSKKNQLTMVRTDSFLACLIFAATQSIPNNLDRETALDARTRAVACLNAVCEPKENRAAVLMYPGMVDCLTKVIDQDDGEARVLACGACALIAKSMECREALAEEERLIILLAQVLGGQHDSQKKQQLKEDATEVDASVAGAKGGKNKGKRTPTPNALEQEKNQRRPDVEETNTLSVSASTTNYPSDGHSLDDDSAYEDQPNSYEDYDDDEEEDDDDHLEDYSRSNSYDDEDDDMSKSVKSTKSKSRGKADPSLRKISKEKSHEFYERARSNSCAVFLHLSKHCPTAVSQIGSMLLGASYISAYLMCVLVSFRC